MFTDTDEPMTVRQIAREITAATQAVPADERADTLRGMTNIADALADAAEKLGGRAAGPAADKLRAAVWSLLSAANEL